MLEEVYVWLCFSYCDMERKILGSFWNDIQYKNIHQFKQAELL